MGADGEPSQSFHRAITRLNLTDISSRCRAGPRTASPPLGWAAHYGGYRRKEASRWLRQRSVKEWWEVVGRIGIDDVAPVVSGGRFPAKAVVGEIVPVRATVWREGHDAVAATLVVRYHGSAYPQLVNGPAGPRDRDVRSRCPSRRSSIHGPHQPHHLPMATGHNAGCVSRSVHPRQRRALDVSGGRVGRSDRDMAQGCHRQAGRRPGRGRAVQRSAGRGAVARTGDDGSAAQAARPASSRRRSCCASPATRSPGPAQRCRQK